MPADKLPERRSAREIEADLGTFRERRKASLSTECRERVGRQIQRDPRAEIEGLLVQMMAIEKLALGGLPKEGRELLDIVLAEEETAANRAEGRKAH